MGKEDTSMDDKEGPFENSVPLWFLTDLDRPRYCYLFIAMRLVQALFFSWNVQHPDEYWQSMEPAYNMVYGGV
jgi:hypothetical protein